jgi:hypothetical protein
MCGIIISSSRAGHTAEHKEIKMYETIKVVNGYAITRMVGTRGCYHVSIREGKGFKEFHTFKTIKAATAFCESL